MNQSFNRFNKLNILNAGCIENIKNQIKDRIFLFLKDSEKHYSISLIGIGTNFEKNKKLDGRYNIRLLANSFKDNKSYFVEIKNNRVSYIKEGKI